MISAAEYEAALCQLEDDPPDFRQYNVNIREERWTNFSLKEDSLLCGRCHTEGRGSSDLRKRSYHSLPTNIESRSSVYPSIAGWHQESS